MMGVSGCMPIWARLDEIMRLSGLPNLVVRRLYNEGHVRARKVDAARTNSATVYRVEDVLNWLDKDAPRPEKFKLPDPA